MEDKAFPCALAKQDNKYMHRFYLQARTFQANPISSDLAQVSIGKIHRKSPSSLTVITTCMSNCFVGNMKMIEKTRKSGQTA